MIAPPKLPPVTVETPGEGFTDITREAARFVTDSKAGDGLLLLFLRHTSASLTVQENADPDVQTDLVTALRRLAPLAVVNVGDSVTWTNTGNAPHSVTSEASLFDSGTINSGDHFTMNFSSPGTYYYYCSIHAAESQATEAHVLANDAMVGKSVVSAAATTTARSRSARRSTSACTRAGSSTSRRWPRNTTWPAPSRKVSWAAR